MSMRKWKEKERSQGKERKTALEGSERESSDFFVLQISLNYYYRACHFSCLFSHFLFLLSFFLLTPEGVPRQRVLLSGTALSGSTGERRSMAPFGSERQSCRGRGGDPALRLLFLAFNWAFYDFTFLFTLPLHLSVYLSIYL